MLDPVSYHHRRFFIRWIDPVLADFDSSMIASKKMGWGWIMTRGFLRQAFI